ncbi:MAG: hypothetical protein FWG52_04325 [Proteobacteria bacterium]|nr:hypothetical protein [Pseudomonadota bacterium]
MCTFSGEFDVVPSEFELEARRFIVRDREIAFELSGSDDEGNFTIEGNVPLVALNTYASTKLPYHYHGWNDTYYADINIQIISIDNEHCRLTGEWKEGDDSWVFQGRLDPYRA